MSFKWIKEQLLLLKVLALVLAVGKERVSAITTATTLVSGFSATVHLTT